jgi:hypothetical protein
MKRSVAVTTPLLILAAILLGWFGLRTWGNNRAIEAGEFTTGKVSSKQNPTVLYDCLLPGPELVERCRKAGGAIQNNVTAIGIGIFYTLGCYPEGKTADAGKKCSSDRQCQGQCLWLAGDMVLPGSSKTCTDFKKPFFTARQQNTDVLCAAAQNNLR